MRVQVYEATLARSDTIQRVRAQQRAIERIGGKVEIESGGTGGMTLVRLILPEPYTPEQFVPGLPFFPA